MAPPQPNKIKKPTPAEIPTLNKIASDDSESSSDDDDGTPR